MGLFKIKSRSVKIVRYADVGQGHIPNAVPDAEAEDDIEPGSENKEHIEVPRFKFLKFIPIALWGLALLSGVQQNLALAIGIIIVQTIFTIIYFIDKAVLVDEREDWQMRLMEFNIVITIVTILVGIFARYKGWTLYKEALMRARAKLRV